MGFLNKVGGALRKFGEVGGKALKPLGQMAGSGIARGLANKAIETFVPGALQNVAKGAVAKAAEFVSSGKASEFLNKVKGAGEQLEMSGG